MFDDSRKYLTDDLVEQVLKQEPDFSLPDNFADVMAEKAGKRFAWEQYLREFLIYLAVIVGAMAVTVTMALIWFQNDWKNWLDFMASNIWIVSGINVLVVFILFADRVLLRYFLYRSDLRNDLS